jgi:hypothetical protein
VTDINVFQLSQPRTFSDPLTEVCATARVRNLDRSRKGRQRNCYRAGST